MVRIRLRRVGARNQPTFRIVATDKQSPRDGRFLEILGHYNPRTEPATVQVDEARLFGWLENGAQPSDSVHRLLNPLGTWERWTRFKQGESLDILLQEAQAAAEEVDPRTRRPDRTPRRPSRKSVAKAQAETEAAEEGATVEEPAMELEAAESDEPEAEVAAEAEVEAEPEQEEAPEEEPSEESES